jgi:succinate dehydrogenase / fumarate reductase membrane anchor subunit
MLWLLIAIARQPAYDYATLHAWMQSAWVAVPMALLILSVFYHFRLGLQVVIEDYQHDESRVVLLVLLNFFVVALGATAIFSILKIAFGAAA